MSEGPNRQAAAGGMRAGTDPERSQFARMGPASDGEAWREDPRDFRAVVEVPEVLARDECDVLLSYIDRFGQVSGAVGAEDGSAPGLDPEVRRVRQTTVPRSPDTAWVYERLAGAIDGCNRELFGFDLRDFNEDLAIVDYREGDFYEWHLDIGHAANSRKLSVSVMLSSPEDYDGGALAFPSAEFDRVPRGSAVVFPSFLLHGVQPVKRGRRCALLAWIGGPRFQ